MRNIKKVNPTTIKVEDFNEYLYALDGRHIKYEKPNGIISDFVFVYEDNRKNRHLIYKDSHTNKTYHFKCDPYLNEVDPLEKYKNNAGAIAMRSLNRFLKKNHESIRCPCNNPKYSWRGFEWYDPDHAYEDLTNVYQYDMNSAYLYYFTKPLPYGDIIRRNSYVNQGEIGFVIENSIDGKRYLETCFEGEYADIIFKTKVYQSFIDYAYENYKKRLLITDEFEKKGFKIRMHALHGNLKYHNVYISTAVVGYCKRQMLALRDDKTIMCTIDSITHIGPMKIDLGNQLGQFKEEHTNEKFMYYNNAVKVWNDTDVYHKGLDKKRAGIVKQYQYNIENNRMEKIVWQETDN